MDILYNGKFTDFEIILPNKVYKVHKAFLCRCDYFSSLFSSANTESLSNSIKLTYEEDLFDNFIELVYSISSPISISKVASILELSIYFQYKELENEMCLSLDKVNNDEFVRIITNYPQCIDKIKEFNKKCISCKSLILDIIPDIRDINVLSKLLTAIQYTQLSSVIIACDKWIDNGGNNNIWEVVSKLSFSFDTDTYNIIANYKPTLLSCTSLIHCWSYLTKAFSNSDECKSIKVDPKSGRICWGSGSPIENKKCNVFNVHIDNVKLSFRYAHDALAVTSTKDINLLIHNINDESFVCKSINASKGEILFQDTITLSTVYKLYIVTDEQTEDAAHIILSTLKDIDTELDDV